MKQLQCPVNGLRDIAEFQYLGPEHPQAGGPENLVRDIFMLPNPLGPMREWWRHTPSNTVFMAERHTVTDEVLRTWIPGGAMDT